MENELLKCEECGIISCSVERRRQNTRCSDEEKNWLTLCPICQEKYDDHWKSMWAELYHHTYSQ